MIDDSGGPGRGPKGVKAQPRKGAKTPPAKGAKTPPVKGGKVQAKTAGKTRSGPSPFVQAALSILTVGIEGQPFKSIGLVDKDNKYADWIVKKVSDQDFTLADGSPFHADCILELESEASEKAVCLLEYLETFSADDNMKHKQLFEAVVKRYKDQHKNFTDFFVCRIFGPEVDPNDTFE
jgi:hypothetical protein